MRIGIPTKAGCPGEGGRFNMDARVSGKFWSDEHIEGLSLELRQTALWLITNPHRTLAGYTEVSPRRFAFETGCPESSLEELLKVLPKPFVRAGKGVWVRNFIRYQFGHGVLLAKNNIAKALCREVNTINNPELWELIALEYPSLRALMERYRETDELQLSDSDSASPSKGVPRDTDRTGHDMTGQDRDSESSNSTDPTSSNDPSWTIQAAKIRLAAIFNRPDTKAWSYAEESALSAAWPIEKEDVILVEWWHRAFSPDESRREIDTRKRQLKTLLENWPGEVDGARAFAKTCPPQHSQNSPKKKKGDAENEPAGFRAWLAVSYPNADQNEPWESIPKDVKEDFAQEQEADLRKSQK